MKRQEMIDLLTGVQSSKINYYTELKTTVEALQKKNSQLEIINEVMSSFTADFSVPVMLERMLAKLQELYPIDRISSAIPNDLKLRLTYVYPEEEVYIEKNTVFPTRNSLFNKVFTTGRDLVYHTGGTEPFFERQGFQQLGLASVHLFPLKSSGITIGVLSLGSRTHFQCTEEDHSFFLNLADQVAVCMENARLYGEVLAGKQRWEETFRAVSDAIVVIAPDGTILSRNDAARSDSIEMGLNIRTTFGQTNRSLAQSFQKTLEMKKTHTTEYHYESDIYDCSWYPLFGADESIEAVILYVKNVTEKRQLEAQLMHSGQLAAIGEMAAGVAHELNNPLTAIIGNTQLLLRTTSLDTTEKSLLEDVEHCGQRCRTIIRNLLSFARQEDFSFKRCALNDAVHEALSLTRRQIEKQQITIELDVTSSLPPIDGNIQQLSQVIVNLLINAKDALAERGIQEKKIYIQTKTQGRSVLLMITDNGMGIAADIVDDIFHPFFTTKDAEHGTGLGLSVSFGIAKAHGGTLSVETKSGAGTTFTLAIPICEKGM